MSTSVVKWSEVYLSEVYMGRSEVSTSVVEWSEVYLSEVYMGRSEVSTSGVKCSWVKFIREEVKCRQV